MHSEEHSLFFASPAGPEKILFSPEELHHLRSVLRKDSGKPILATDGKGSLYSCIISPGEPLSGEANIIMAERSRPLAPALDVFIGLPEREGFEESLVHLSAMGIARIIPVICRYCQKEWWENWEKHSDRLNRKMIAGIKQARSPWLPELERPVGFSDLLENRIGRNGKIIAADSGGIDLQAEARTISAYARISCVVGPPGGLSPEEKANLAACGAAFVSIARNRLRTELAAVVLCANLIQFQK